MDIVWSPMSRRRMMEIIGYYRYRNKKTAAQLLAELKKATGTLKVFPHIGPTEPALPGRAYRSLLVRNRYKIVYRVDEQTEAVHIITVWDCHMDSSKMVHDTE